MTLQAFDPRSMSFTADPHPVLKALRESDPVHFFEPLGCWVLTRYDDVHTFFADRRVKRLFNSDLFMDEAPLAAPASPSEARARHSHERASLNPGCSPQAVKLGTDLIDRIVRERLAPLRQGDEVVDVAAILGAIPNIVVTKYFGVAPDEGDEQEFLLRTREAFRRWNIFLTDEARGASDAALKRFYQMLRHVLDKRRDNPSPDRIIDLFGMNREGGLHDDVILAWLGGLIMAGSDTTAQSALLTLRLLLTYPDEADRLRRDPSLIPNAVLECLRFDLAGKFVSRLVTEDFILRGHQFREGDVLFLSPTAAHRDPLAFPDPERLDVGRDTSREIVFGRGPHRCIGAHLALAELASMVREFLEIFPRGSCVLEDQLAWDPSRLNIRLLESLPIRRGRTAGRTFGPAMNPAGGALVP
jgi:cytochrome P450